MESSRFAVGMFETGSHICSRFGRPLSSLFRDLDVENEWLREPHSLLHRKSPLALLSNGSVEDLLIVKEYVDTVAGR